MQTPLKRAVLAAISSVVLVLAGALPAVATAGPRPYPIPLPEPRPWAVGGHPVTDPTPVVALYDPAGFICGGTLIADDTVLTAGHCASDVPTSQAEAEAPPTHSAALHVQAGSPDRTAGEARQVTGVELHPDWTWAQQPTSPSGRISDIAVLHLDSPVRSVTPARVAPLQPDRPVQPADSSHCRSAHPGIGAGETGLASERLLTGPCFGDSGSPGLQDGAVVGIVSRGTGALVQCGVGFTVVTDPSSYESWITETITKQRATS